jgi:hypothetical protein
LRWEPGRRCMTHRPPSRTAKSAPDAVMCPYPDCVGVAVLCPDQHGLSHVDDAADVWGWIECRVEGWMHEACPVSVHEDRSRDDDPATWIRPGGSDQVHERLGCDDVRDAGNDQVIVVAEVAEICAYPRPASTARDASPTGSAVAAPAEPICPKRARSRRQRTGTRDREPSQTGRLPALPLERRRPGAYGRREYSSPRNRRGGCRRSASRMSARTAAAS